MRRECVLGRAARRRDVVAWSVCRIEWPNPHGMLEAFAHTDDASWGDGQCGGSGNVLEKLLAHPGTTVFCPLKLVDPVIDGGVKLSESLLLLEHRVMAELGSTRRPEVLADPSMEVASAGAEGGVGASKVLSAFVELAELLGNG